MCQVLNTDLWWKGIHYTLTGFTYKNEHFRNIFERSGKQILFLGGVNLGSRDFSASSSTSFFFFLFFLSKFTITFLLPFFRHLNLHFYYSYLLFMLISIIYTEEVNKFAEKLFL